MKQKNIFLSFFKALYSRVTHEATKMNKTSFAKIIEYGGGREKVSVELKRETYLVDFLLMPERRRKFDQ